MSQHPDMLRHGGESGLGALVELPLQSAPLIAGAVASKLPALIKMHKAGGLDLPPSTLAISILVSGVGGYLVIAFFLRYLQTRTLKVFIVYRLVFGIIVLVLAFLHTGAR